MANPTERMHATHGTRPTAALARLSTVHSHRIVHNNGLFNLSNFAPKDWYEATNACAAEGKVLCGVEEPCSRSGCMYDHHYQWTGQECQAGDAGFAC